MSRYLIIQTAFLGDVTLSLGMADYIKQQDPRADTAFVTTPAAAPIVEHCPFVDHLLIFDKRGEFSGLAGIWRLANRLRSENFDVVFTPHRSFRSALLTFLSGIRPSYGFNTSAGRWLFSRRVNYISNDHEILRDLALVRQHWQDADQSLILPTLAVGEPVGGDLATGPIVGADKSDVIAIAPGSVWTTKRWPVEKWIELLQHPEMAGQQFVLIGGRADAKMAAEIMARIDPATTRVDNRAGKDDLAHTFRVIARSRLLISNDSGPQHFALALRTPVITIFGSTVPAFGFYPVGEHDRIVEPPFALACRPCGIHGHRQCPVGTLECMQRIEPEQVIRQVKQIEQELLNQRNFDSIQPQTTTRQT